MKKIISGKMYDTNTAKCVGNWSNGCYTNDLHYCSEELYRKKTGEFFLCGDGGAMSKYSQSCSNNNWVGGSKLIPLTETEARAWGEKYLNVEEYESEFGKVSE